MTNEELSLALIDLQHWLQEGQSDRIDQLLSRWISHQQFNTSQWVEVRNLLFAASEQIKEIPNVFLCWIRIEKLLGMSATAVELLNQLLQTYPNHIDALRELGWLYAKLNQQEEAVHCFSQLVLRHRSDWTAWNDGGCSLRALGQRTIAIQWMKNACEACPDNPNLFANLALLHYELHEFDAAQHALNKAFEIAPNNAEALHTQGMLYARLGRFDEAYAVEYKALEVKPNYPQVRLSLALLDLTCGKWAQGFAGYESRWVGSDSLDAMPTITRPQWRGHPVYPGSTIAILPEQGLGDHLQFARFIPQLLDIFNQVEWVVPVGLLSLFVHSFKHQRLTFHVTTDTLPLSQIDFECPLMSLPLALGVTSDNLPNRAPYLNPDDNAHRYWAEQVKAASGRLKVGLAWSGRPTLAAHSLRSVPPELLERLDHPHISFFNLQKTDGDAISTPRMTHWHDWIDQCDDFNATAALVSQLDLIISTDTSIAHLAGALGKPVWLLNRLGGEWRWLRDRVDSPWYPSMRLFNQRQPGQWEPVIKEVAIALNREKYR